MKVGLAQVNPTVGDLEGNVARCLAAVHEAEAAGAELVVLPEMAVPGYPPRDILLDPSFVVAAEEAVADLAMRARRGPPVVVGTVLSSGSALPRHPGLWNAAALLEGGEVRQVVAKRLLPAYDVFHEPRWFLPGPPSRPIPVAGARLGLLVCEDLWDEGYPVHPAAGLLEAGAQLLVTIAASPYRAGVLERRLYHARQPAAPVVFVNSVGGNDELVFDGRSFAVDAGGKVVARLAAFSEEVRVLDLASPRATEPDDQPAEEELFVALVLGVRDFVAKNRLAHAYLGLSGGIDSALVAVIAAEALGPRRVTAVAMPSRYTDPRSTSCASELAESLGIGFEVVELEPLHAAAAASLGELLEDGSVAENLQARLRMTVLMAFVNRSGGLLLNTSNKTELALGYGTLYGDMAGTLCPIGDLTKPQVVSLARWVSKNRCPIPLFTLERPPSAELRADQVDPFDYDRVAPEMEELVRANRSDGALRRSEHKRWQSGVILKVSEKAFGSGRLMPITRR